MKEIVAKKKKKIVGWGWKLSRWGFGKNFRTNTHQTEELTDDLMEMNISEPVLDDEDTEEAVIENLF